MFFILGLIAWFSCNIIFAFIAMSDAMRKQRSGLAWFIGGLFFGPIALMIVSISLPLSYAGRCPNCSNIQGHSNEYNHIQITPPSPKPRTFDLPG